MRRGLVVVLWVVGVLAVARAAMEPFVIDTGDPSTYRADWGGPSLAGVLAVHMLPGLVAAALMAVALVRARRRRGTQRSPARV